MGQGFPSGHAAVVAAMATVVSPYLSTRGRVVVWLTVALVALARVYTGAHLPFDVVAGVFVGWITGSFINLVTGGWAVARPQAGRTEGELAAGRVNPAGGAAADGETMRGESRREKEDGWRGRTRTFNPLIQSQVPCQLGHSPATWRVYPEAAARSTVGAARNLA